MRSVIQENVLIKEKYKIIRQLGQGGMAQVWLAEEIKMGNRQVAIKAPLPGMSEDETRILQTRFQREVKVCAELVKADTPNIVKAITVEPFEDGDLLILEYMPGGDLAQRIAEHPKGMKLEEVLKISKEILTALDAVHNHPLAITHRDIKPSNVLFNAKGLACLGDFGLAQIGKTSVTSKAVAGQSIPFTPLYRAPELSSVDGIALPQSDIFSFECVLFEMLTGKVARQTRPGTPPSQMRTDIPEWLDELVLRGLTEDPWERWQTASEISVVIGEHKKKVLPRKKSISKKKATVKKADSLNAPSKPIGQIKDKPIKFVNDRHLTFIGGPADSEYHCELEEVGGEITVPVGYQIGIRQKVSSRKDIEQLIGTAHGLDVVPISGFDLSECKISSDDLMPLSQMENLIYLNLYGCDQITDAGLAHLKGLSNLANLNISGCNQISDAGLAHLQGLSNLTNLDISGCYQISDAGLAHLKGLSNLTNLELGLCDHITDAGLAHLKELTNLKHLKLDFYNQITDAGLVHLKGLSKLARLELFHCDQITDAGLVHLRGLSNLANLNISGCNQISDAGLAQLKGLSNLTNLDLYECDQITDAAKDNLKKFIPSINMNY